MWIFKFSRVSGRRAPVNQYQRCNLGKAKSNAIVTRGGSQYNETQINAYINLFIYAQQFNGKREADEFRLVLMISRNFCLFLSLF